MDNRKKLRELNDVQIGYLAGLIDGEGTITLTFKDSRAYRQLVVTISNNELPLLERIIKITGVGTIIKKKPKNKKHFLSYTYRITNRQALELLKKIHPYLMTYKRIRSQMLLKSYLKLTPRNGRYSKSIFKKRGAFIEKFFKIKAGVEVGRLNSRPKLFRQTVLQA